MYKRQHPPAVVNHYYGAGGCYNCGGWPAAGAAVAGAAVGAVAATAVTAGAVATANANAANAYAAGVAAGSGYMPGAVYAALPGGCSYAPMNGAAYYTCAGNVWFTPYYGANGMYYRVVPAP